MSTETGPSLPPELWSAVLDHVVDHRDLESLSRTTASLRDLLRSQQPWKRAFRSDGPAVYAYRNPELRASLLRDGDDTDTPSDCDHLCTVVRGLWDWRHVCRHAVRTEDDRRFEADRDSVFLVVPGDGEEEEDEEVERRTIEANVDSVVIVGLSDADASSDIPFWCGGSRGWQRVKWHAVEIVVQEGTDLPPGQVVLCGLDLSSTTTTVLEVRCATNVRLVGCSFMASGGSLIAVDCQTPGCAVELLGCEVRESAQCGLVTRANTALRCDRTVVDRCRGSSCVFMSSRVSLSRCKVTSSGQFGAYLSKTTASIVDCDISGSQLSGVLCRDEACHVSITRTKVHDNKECGLLVSTNGVVNLTDCVSEKNELSAVEVRESGELSAKNSSMMTSGQQGLTVVAARAMLEYCTLSRNSWAGIYIRERASAVLLNCVIAHNYRSGIYVSEECEAKVDSCRMIKNGFGVRSKGTISMTNNVIAKNLGGIQVLEGQSTVSGNQLLSNEEISPTVQKAIAAGICTYLFTGASFYSQWYFPCETCDPGSDSTGCCEVCALVCHQGHKLGSKRFGSFYCDCFSAFRRCQAAPPDRELRYHVEDCLPPHLSGDQ